MIRALARCLVAVFLVTVAGGGPTLADAFHGAAHLALADHHAELDHHHDGGDDHHQPAPVDRPDFPADRALDHAEPDHPHADADQLRSSGPTDFVVPSSRPVVVAALAPLRHRPSPSVDPIPLQSTTAARPPTRAPPTAGLHSTFR